MAKNICKYFIALVPVGALQEEVTAIKEDLKEKFGLKYALKSPAHVTLKMPFGWNEAKEDNLINSLEIFARNHKSIKLSFQGFGKFGNRVIYIKVKQSEQLGLMQSALAEFCKRELKLVKELSDTNYHPHMTIAFKDMKVKFFEEYWNYTKGLDFNHSVKFDKFSLLKKIDNRWISIKEINLNSITN
ncbi:2'-5' RNA ligase family protein [Belliella sp. R4-6]|uniref:2'-5' RNA ligase family protein n=1 Tax=Belliella alkalica TaxID=1730871 RepID=A0ABS9VCK8_9BACT|nr:2'-5' RNA ligase family protein [Belliella alkalica]MCH7414162.1 2'-5' RNA ligase family protein [Belliella alkalica]